MAIDAKVSFINQLAKNLANDLTVNNMNTLMRTVSDVLEGFDMREVKWQEDYEDDLLKSFLDALKVQGRSQKTLARYQYEIQRLMKFVGVPVRRITVYHVRAYFAKEKERGIKDSTIEGVREVYSSYFTWLKNENLIERNPMANIGTVKTEKLEKVTLSETDMANLDSHCATLRDRAIVHFLRSTGCRISEMTGLNRDDINITEKECVVHGKGNKQRTVYLSPVAAMYLVQYLNTRKDNDPALFISYRKTRLHPGGVRRMLNQLSEKTMVDHVHPHKFRRTLATSLARRGMPIQEIARILGHESIETTMEYVVLNNDIVKASYRRYT